MVEQTQSALNSIPKTASGFIKDFSGLLRGKNQEATLAYLKNIPVKQFEVYFKRTEIEAETFSAIAETLTQGLKTKDDCIWAASFLLSLTKADNFELTVSFAEDKDRENMKEIIKRLKALTGDECGSQITEIQYKFESQ